MTEKNLEKGRIEEALGKYNLNVSDEEVKAAVKKIIVRAAHFSGTEETSLSTEIFSLSSMECVLKSFSAMSAFAYDVKPASNPSVN